MSVFTSTITVVSRNATEITTMDPRSLTLSDSLKNNDLFKTFICNKKY